MIRGLRWWIVGLVFLATFINFLDRLTVSVLAPVITKDLGLTNLQFAGISTWFLAAYTVSQGLSGRIYDRVGTRLGFAGDVAVTRIDCEELVGPDALLVHAARCQEQTTIA